MTRFRDSSIYVMALLGGLAVINPVAAQTQTKGCEATPKEIVELADKRSQMQKLIDDDNQAMRDLPNQVEQARKYEQDLADVNKKIDALKNHAPSDPNAYQQQSDNLSKLKEQTEKLIGGKTSANLLALQQSTAKDLDTKHDDLRCIEKALYSASSPDQFFKVTMSASFAALILAVIAGFYWLSNKDKQMRRAIFSGQEGIQFLTLFSIVIAVILFGITSILQDKELAALLGGLSGYILGRYNAPGQGQQAAALTSTGQTLTSTQIPPPVPPQTQTAATFNASTQTVMTPAPDAEDAESHIDGCEVGVLTPTADEELPITEGGVG